MKNASTGKTSPTELVSDPDSPSTTVADWEGAVLKQGGVVVDHFGCARIHLCKLQGVASPQRKRKIYQFS